MNKPSVILVSTSEDFATFKSLCKDKGLSRPRLFSHMLHKFPCGKHIIEFDELPIDSKPVRFGLLLNDADIKKLDSLCNVYGVKRPLIFKILLSWYDKSIDKNKPFISHFHP